MLRKYNKTIRLVFLLLGLLTAGMTGSASGATEEEIHQYILVDPTFGTTMEDIHQWETSRNVEPLIKLLLDHDYKDRENPLEAEVKYKVRKEVVKALVKIGDARSVEGLIADLSFLKENQETEMWVSLFGDNQTRDEATGVVSIPTLPLVPNALVEIGARAVDPLISALHNGNKDARVSIVDVLGYIGDIKAIDPLSAALKNEDRDVRQAAAQALGRIGNARSAEPLYAATQDNDKVVRQYAVLALGQIGDARAVELLIAELPNGDKGLPASEQRPLDSEQIVQLWTELEQDRDVQENAVILLGKLHDARAVEPLIAALRDGAKDFKQALGKIDESGKQLKEWDKRVKQRAAVALGNIGDTKAVYPLIAALRDGDADIRQWAAWALGEISDARAVDPLIAALRDGDKDVRVLTEEALGKISDVRAVDPLITALWDGDKDIRKYATLALLNKTSDARAVDLLTAILRDGDKEVRQRAVEALGKRC